MISRLLPLPASPDVVTYKIFSEGKQVSDTIRVIAMTVTREVNKISSARVILHDGDPAKEDFELSNEPDFAPGKEIKIELGYHSKNTTVFKGIVVKHGIKVRRNKPSQLVIDLKDKAVKMTLVRKSKLFTDTTDKAILDDIIGSYGLQKMITPSKAQHKQMVQHNATDWDFLLSRADANAMLVYTYDGKVTVAPPDFAQLPALSALYGATIMEMEAELDAESQLEAVSAHSWDVSSQKIVSADGKVVMPKEQGNLKSKALAGEVDAREYQLFHSGQLTSAELQAWADAKLQRSRLAKIRGRVRIQGYGKVKPGELIEMGGVGDRFKGSAFVSGVRHEFGNTWTTDIEFGIDPELFARQQRDVSEVPASGLLPAINGLHIGTVTQLEGDPENENKILVKIPIISEKEDGIWARLAGIGSGDSKGFIFRPDVGDEVIVGFINDDPRNAVVLGSLYSSTKPAPADIPLSDDNFLKGIVTKKEGMKFIFDDEKNIVTLETPGENKIVISDEEKSITITDQNANQIIMNEDGILLKSDKEIVLDAKDVTIKTTEGDISHKAAGNFVATTNAGGELSLSTNAVLKGALVEIN